MAAIDRSNLRRREAVLLVLGLLLLSVGYLTMLVRVVVINPDATSDAATRVLADTEVRAALARRTADAVTTQLVGQSAANQLALFGIDVRRDLQPVAEGLVRTPEFADAYTQAVKQLHTNVFVDPSAQPHLDVTALVARARAQAIAINPAYRDLIPESSTLVVSLPAESLPDLSIANRALSPFLALGASALGLTSVGIAMARGARQRVLQIAGSWTLVLGGLQLAATSLGEQAVDRMSGDLAPIARAATHAVLPMVVLPALGLIALGVTLRAVSLRRDHVVSRSLAKAGRNAFLNDEHGRPVEWSFDAAYEPETLRTAPGKVTFRR